MNNRVRQIIDDRKRIREPRIASRYSDGDVYVDGYLDGERYADGYLDGDRYRDGYGDVHR